MEYYLLGHMLNAGLIGTADSQNAPTEIQGHVQYE